MTKKCPCCCVEKSNIEFFKNNAHKDKLSSYCKICYNMYTKKYRKENKVNLNIKNKLDRKNNPEKYHKNYKNYYTKNKEKVILKTKNYKLKNRYNINFRLMHSLRSRISYAIKHGSAVKDLGCSLEEFKVYLESKFQEGMSWSNYGKWHLDHIFPLSKADLTNKEEFLKVTHYTNYQPLWAIDNIRKGNKILCP